MHDRPTKCAGRRGRCRMSSENHRQHAPDAPDRAVVAQMLDQYAAVTCDRRFRHAAAILRASPVGRPACPDDAAVTEVLWLVEAGRAGTIEEAAPPVAST